MAGATDPHEVAEHVTVQVTLGAADGSFETVAVNCAVLPDATVAVPGETDTEMACKFTVIVAVLVESEMDVAVIVAVVFDGTGDGAV